MVWRWMKVCDVRGLQQRFADGLRRFDEIAEEMVVFDLELTGSGGFAILRLQLGDDAPALVAQRARFIKLRAEA